MWLEAYVNNDPKLALYDSYIFKMMSVMDMLERKTSQDNFRYALIVLNFLINFFNQNKIIQKKFYLKNYIELSQESVSTSMIDYFYQKFDGFQVEEFVNSWYGHPNYPIVDIRIEYYENIQKSLIKFEQSRFLLNNFQENNTNSTNDDENSYVFLINNYNF